MKKLVIDIYKLSNKLHQYEFEIEEAFFSTLKQDLVNSGILKAVVDLDKNDSFIGMEVKIEGTVELTCDRTLEQFQYPISVDRKVIFKFGNEERELEHDVVMITNDTQQIDVGQYIFEFVGLAVPMKKLHPRFDENEEEFGSLVYSSEYTMEEDDESTPDPRWKKLNDLKRTKEP